MASYADKPTEFKEFDGLRNTTTPERLEPVDLQAAENVDIDDAKRLTRRGGTVLRVQGATHSLWSDADIALAVQGATLNSVRPTGATSYELDALRAGLTVGLRMSYWRVVDRVYFLNGAQTGCVQEGAARTWGLEQPPGQPGAQAFIGSLPSGRYQFALTYLRNDGQESGTPGASIIELTEQGGIRFTGIPVSSDPTVVAKAIYLSGPDGEVLYRAITVPNATTTADYRNAGYDLTLPLNTQFGRPAPAGHLCAGFAGRMLVAYANGLYWSEPYRYELFMLHKAFALFPVDLTMVAPVDDGVYVSADKTYWLGGRDPAAWAPQVVANYPAIPGTLSYVPVEGEYIGEGVARGAAVWASTRGHCVGGTGGSFKNLTQSRYSYPATARGAGILRQVNGINQYLAVLEGAGEPNNAYSPAESLFSLAIPVMSGELAAA